MQMSLIENEVEASYSSSTDTSIINENVTKIRMKRQGTSNLETLMHIIKANIGTGVLAMPLAFKNGGLLLSSISIWIMGVICVHCMHILLNSYRFVYDNMLKNSDNPVHTLTYDDVIEFSMSLKYRSKPKIAKFARIAVITFLIISQLGFCIVYVVFIPTNIKQVIDQYYPKNDVRVEIYMCILLMPTVLFCFVKDLKILAPFSTLANFFMISGMFVILYELLTGVHVPIESINLVAPVNNWAIFYSSAIYAFEGINLVLPVHHGMKDKEYFSPWNGVLNTGMALVAIMYFSIGFFGYLKYGDMAAASITLNLPADQVPYQILKILFATAIFISYNLQFLVAADVLWAAMCRNSKLLQNYAHDSSIPSNKRRLYIFENMFRSCMVLFTFALAILIPRIDLFISLIGAVAGSILALVVPPILDILLFLPEAKYYKIKLFKNILILLFGAYIFVAGTYVSLRDIVKYFQGK